MQGGFIKRHVVDGGPQVQDVAVGGAFDLETMKNVFAQMNGTGVFFDGNGGRRFGMNRTGTAPLLSFALEQAQNSQVLEYLFYGDLLAKEGEIQFGSCRR